jgi:hypothetical protein
MYFVSPQRHQLSAPHPISQSSAEVRIAQSSTFELVRDIERSQLFEVHQIFDNKETVQKTAERHIKVMDTAVSSSPMAFVLSFNTCYE